jgi:hypothetical protein
MSLLLFGRELQQYYKFLKELEELKFLKAEMVTKLESSKF